MISSLIFSRVRSPTIFPVSKTGTVLQPSRRICSSVCLEWRGRFHAHAFLSREFSNGNLITAFGQAFDDILRTQNALDFRIGDHWEFVLEPASSSVTAFASVSSGARDRKRRIMASRTCNP